MLVPFENGNAAHYLCAALNSSPAQFIVLSYAVNIQMNTHVLQNVRITYYEPKNKTHDKLAVLSQQAHEAMTIGDIAQVQAIESEIDRLAAQLWSLTDAELQDIQASLEELQ
jgi:hypothetical protein